MHREMKRPSAIAAVVLFALVAITRAQSTRPTTLEANEREVTFEGVGGAKRIGTLTLAENHGSAAAKSPGVVLVCGSGPTDRDGNQRPTLITDTQKQIAQDLAKRGIASFRYDKRGIAASAPGAPFDLAGMTRFYAWENFSGDVIAAFRCLQQQPETDPSRTALIGHSEGALLALVAADQMKAEAHPPRALVLLATPGRPIEALIDEQLTRLLKLQGATDVQARKILDKNAEVSGHIRATGQTPTNVPRGLQALYPAYLGKFFQSQFAVDPTKLAVDFSGPVLVINGEKDQNVSAERDAKAIDAALRSRPQNDPRNTQELFIVPGASHSLKPTTSDLDPGFTGTVIPEALAKIGSFLERKLRD